MLYLSFISLLSLVCPFLPQSFISHIRSLIASNSHLLQELNDTRKRHSLEVSQLQTNYDQLRQLVHDQLGL